jgi:hypothetical protein
MARISPKAIAPLDIALETPFLVSELQYAKRAKRVGSAELKRLRRAEAITKAPFTGVAKKYRKGAPAGPVSSIGSSALGIGAALPAYVLPASWATGAALSIPAYAAGKWVGRKALKPIDKAVFEKQLKRTARIKSQLETLRGV